MGAVSLGLERWRGIWNHPAAIALRLGMTWGSSVLWRLLVSFWLLVVLAPSAWAGGPRYVTGPPFFTGQQGVPIGWRQTNLTYFTDPGSLNASMSHQASDALVAAAANVWNLPVASITVAQGGTLAEHVSSQNAYMGANGMVFPADVMSTNAAAVPISIIYDTDGSVTDTLLGSGASSPSECAQDGVTESVDAFDPAGYILHAVIILNGRCTGSAPQLQLQMQYELERVFGRVLGLAWSQTNDNVFTGTPQPTAAQAQNWPIMHPIDIICGSYTYQCLPSPFQLRPDDIAAMVAVYPIAQGTTPAAGKQSSLNNATGLSGAIFFPSGEGMEGVNVLVKRQYPGTTVNDGWYETSAVTGGRFRRAPVSVFATAGTDALSSMGNTDMNWPGYYVIPYIPMEAGYTGENLVVSLEAVNPLYSGAHSLGPYAPGNVAFSGTPLTLPTIMAAQEGGLGAQYWTVADADAACGNGSDGTASVPMEAPATGWWNGLLCGYGHASYFAADVKPGRTFTVEVTALDEHGYATTTKAMPVIAAFAPTDGSTPSLGLAATAFQAWGVGTTTLTASTGTLTNVRVGIADQRGDGRPDFAYQARMFYADSVTPARIPTAGATITISGSGFRSGNAVSINGVAVSVVSWTASTIVVTAPRMSSVGATNQTAVDVVVWDRTTGATSTMTAALTYDSSAGLSNAMRLVSVQEASVYVGDTAPIPFAVQVVTANGSTPVAGDTVVLTAVGGALLGACGSAVCSVQTDANGMVSTTVTPTTAGTITLTATDGALQQTGSFTALAQAGSIIITIAPVGAVNVGVQAGNPLGVQVLMPDGTPMRNAPVTFNVVTGGATFGGCNSSVCTVTAGGDGMVGVWVTPTTVGPITLEASVGDVKQTASFTGASNVDTMQVVGLPVSPQYVYVPDRFTVKLLHPDGSPDWGELVTFSAPVGVSFGACGSNVCTMGTDGSGSVGLVLTGTVAGAYTIQAAYGSVMQTVPLVVQNHTYQINLVSQPANNAVTYVSAPVPFAVQVMQDGTTPAAGALVEMTGVLGDLQYDACGARDCLMTTDANGIASTTVTPLVAGAIVLNAVYNTMAVTTSFTAQGSTETIRILSQPSASGLVMGTTWNLIVQVVGVDGVTLLANHRLYFTVVSGPFGFTTCTAATCLATTGGDGTTGIVGTPYGAGPVIVQVQDANGQATQLIQFVAVALPDVLKLVSGPASGGYPGVAASVPFAVQALFNDGVTPFSGRSVTVAVTNGQATLAACGGAASCVLTTDANGMISTQVTPGAVGSITVTATDGAVTVSSSFTVVPRPDTMVLVAAPAASVYVGATTTMTVKVIEGDGVTPRAGAGVVFSVTGGTAQLGSCGGSSCTVTTAADGTASIVVTPSAAGPVSLQAVDGALLQTAGFMAVARPDVLSVVSAPANGAWVGVVAAAAFSVRLLQGDGVTPDAGKTIVVAATGGTLGACGASSCSLVADGNGLVSTSVTPIVAGTVTLTAAGGGQTTTVTFIAAMRPDVLSVVSVPASGGVIGVVAPGTFSVRLMQGDGVTPDIGKTIAFSVTGGTLGACGAAACSLVTDANGLASTTVTPLMAGTIALQAVDGSLVQTASFTAVRPDTLSVVSAPANGSWVGVIAANTFSVRLVQGDGVTPDAGKTITLSATGAVLGCGSSCALVADANGVVSTTVTPSNAGSVALMAVGGGQTDTVTFTAAARPDVLSVVSVPANGSWVGLVAASSFSVQLMQGDGVTPDAGKTITLSATGAVLGCGSGCALVADGNGVVSTTVTPSIAGTVALTAVGSGQTATVTFTASVRPDVLSVVSLPANGSWIGMQATNSFSVRLLQGDGVTPDAGKSITLTAAGAVLGCGSSCTLVADANGMASTTVTPTAAGIVTLAAAGSGQSVTATFTANAPDLFSLVTTPGASVLAGVTAATPLSVKVVLADGVTPVAGTSVTFAAGSGSGGSVRYGACGAATCTLITGANGIASTTVTGGAAGGVTLSATAALPTGMVTLTAGFTVLPNQYSLTTPNVALFVAEGATVPIVLEAVANENGAVSVGQDVHWTQTGGYTLAAADSLTDATGTASVQAMVGPLAGGAQVGTTACAWTNVCVQFAAVGVAAGDLQIQVSGGGGQAVAGGNAFAPLTLQVVDTTGHPVAGAAVSVYQTVTALDAACPTRGRCPAAPVLASVVTVLTSSSEGTVSIVPLSLSGAATSTEIAASVGTQGFVTSVLTSQP